MKNLKIIFALLVILSLFLSACGGTTAKPFTFETLKAMSILPQPDGRKDYQMLVEPVTSEVAAQGMKTKQATKYYMWFYVMDNQAGTNNFTFAVDIQDIVSGKFPIVGIGFWPYGNIQTKTTPDFYVGGIVGISQDFIKQHVENPESLSDDAQKTMISLCVETAKAKQADPKFCTE